jgi:hypothetical protein
MEGVSMCELATLNHAFSYCIAGLTAAQVGGGQSLSKDCIRSYAPVRRSVAGRHSAPFTRHGSHDRMIITVSMISNGRPWHLSTSADDWLAVRFPGRFYNNSESYDCCQLGLEPGDKPVIHMLHPTNCQTEHYIVWVTVHIKRIRDIQQWI